MDGGTSVVSVTVGAKRVQPRPPLSLWPLLKLWFLEHDAPVPIRTSSNCVSTFWDGKGGMLSHRVPCVCASSLSHRRSPHRAQRSGSHHEAGGRGQERWGWGGAKRKDQNCSLAQIMAE